MKLILFIGHHKVGSSSLQRFLSQNYLSLLKAGILYPHVDPEGAAYNIATALNGADGTTALPINVREAHNAMAFRMLTDVRKKKKMPVWHQNIPSTEDIFNTLYRQIEVLQPKAMILCAEVFSNFAAVDPGLIELLKTKLAVEDTTILCTLRRPDEYLVSWQGQRLKFGQQLNPLRADGIERYLSTIHFDYRLMLNAWMEIFSDATFVLRDYQSVIQSGGSAKDFQRHAGLEFPAGLNIPENANPSIPACLMEIARLANFELRPQVAQDLKTFLSEVPDHLDLPPTKSVEMFGPENRARLVQEFAPINQFLQEKTGRPVFFLDFADVAELRPLPELVALRKVLPQVQALAAKRLYSARAKAFLAAFEAPSS